MDTQNLAERSISRRPWRSRIGWWTMMVLSVAIGLFAVMPYLLPNPGRFQDTIMTRFAHAPLFELGSLYLHIIPAGIALLIGPLQFVTRLRTAQPSVHRWAGRVYLASICLAATGALLIAPRTTGGLSSAFGFSMLAVLWLITAWNALRAIRNGDVGQHRAWMIRNYALTFGAVTLRLYLALLIVLLQPSLATTYANNFDALLLDAYRTVAWLAWVPNLLVAEWVWVWRIKPQRQVVETTARAHVARSSAS